MSSKRNVIAIAVTTVALTLGGVGIAQANRVDGMNGMNGINAQMGGYMNDMRDHMGDDWNGHMGDDWNGHMGEGNS